MRFSSGMRIGPLLQSIGSARQSFNGSRQPTTWGNGTITKDKACIACRATFAASHGSFERAGADGRSLRLVAIDVRTTSRILRGRSATVVEARAIRCVSFLNHPRRDSPANVIFRSERAGYHVRRTPFSVRPRWTGHRLWLSTLSCNLASFTIMLISGDEVCRRERA